VSEKNQQPRRPILNADQLNKLIRVRGGESPPINLERPGSAFGFAVLITTLLLAAHGTADLIADELPILVNWRSDSDV
jgi:hypothetical protein